MRDWRERGEVLDSDDEDRADGLRTWPLVAISNNIQTHIPARKDNTDESRSDGETRQKIYGGTNDENNDLIAVERAITAAHAKNGIFEQPSAQRHQRLEPSYKSTQSTCAVRHDRATTDQALVSLLSTPQYETNGRASVRGSSGSSPLSELSVDTPDFSQEFLRRLAHEHAESLNTTTPQSALDVEHRQILAELQAGATHGTARRRNLRERTAKQLHPFLEERARYLELCRSRGMRPVRISDTTHRQQEVATQEDGDLSISHGITDQAEAQASDRDRLSFSQSTGPQSPTEQLTGDGENFSLEFTDSERTEHREVMNGVQLASSKRRKLQHRQTAIGKLMQPRHGTLSEQYSLPSPSLTSSPASSAELPSPIAALMQSRTSPGRTPAVSLPTPNVSSATKPILVSSDHEEEGINDVVLPISRDRAILPLSSSASETESELERETEGSPKEESQEGRLLHERRRIRGVLPASWLRLDMRKQGSDNPRTSKGPKHTRQLQSVHAPDDRLPVKGLARRRSISKLSHQKKVTPIDLESDTDFDTGDESSTWTDRELVQQHLSLDEAGQLLLGPDYPDVDQMEHDWIDPLASRGQTEVPRKSHARKRQSLIREAFSTAMSREQNIIRPSEHRLVARGLKKRVRAQRHHKQSRIPQLSILDVSERSQGTIQPPQFVRLAVRHAQQHTNRSRQSPTRKYLSLHTSEDTGDALKTLQAWRHGSIRPIRKLSRRQTQTSIVEHIRNAPGGAIEQDTHVSPSADGQQPFSPVSHDTQSADRSRGHGSVNLASGAKANDQLRRSGITGRNTPHDIRHRITTRAAQLEISDLRPTNINRADLFAQRLRILTSVATRRKPILPPPLRASSSEKAMNCHHSADLTTTSTDQQVLPSVGHHNNPDRRTIASTRRRKRMTKHVQLEEFTDVPDVPSLLPNIHHSPVHDVSDEPLSQDILIDLRPPHQRYPVDFDARVLPPGSYFSSETFIGSGDFATALNLPRRDLSTPAGRISIHVDNQLFEWTVWTEEVRSGLGTICNTFLSMLNNSTLERTSTSSGSDDALSSACMDYLLRSLVRYCTHCLWFHESIDRVDCALALLSICSSLKAHATSRNGFRILPWLMLLAFQTDVVASHSSVQTSLQTKARENLSSICEQALALVTDCSLQQLHSCLQGITDRYRRVIITDDYSTLALVVQLHHIARRSKLGTFWSLFDSVLGRHENQYLHIEAQEQIWRAIFGFLPALSIDSKGTVSSITDIRSHPSDWVMPQKLLRGVLSRYDATSRLPGATVNHYVRVLLHRSHLLVKTWNWWKCETWLAVVFDFFAKRGLSFLHGEPTNGSPAFLEDLRSQPTPDPGPGDSSYHVFLKTMVSAFKGLRSRSLYSDKKINSILWRFVPSHGRTYPKEADMRYEDLHPLRNHYDLLCVLYYVSPPGHRIKISLLEDLINHASSHHAACRISIRAWTNLASFQTSLSDPFASLQPVLDWFNIIAHTTQLQYRLARTEAEEDYRHAQAEGLCHVTTKEMEDIVATNQRHVSAATVDLLAGIKNAVCHAINADVAAKMVRSCEYWKLFIDLGFSNPNARAVILEGLEVAQACLLKGEHAVDAARSTTQGDDSQEFGDTTAVEELAAVMDKSGGQEADDLIRLHQQPLMQILSTAFGAETMPDDTILIRCVDVWIKLTTLVVGQKRRSWRDLLEGYVGSWYQLRNTKQRRLFTPAVLARIVNCARRHDLPRTHIISGWLVSLVEREATLKYQHELTSALLENWSDDALLYNLPFARSRSTDLKYSIALADIRQRRLALIAAVLHNMRQDYQNSETLGSAVQKERRSMYTTMLHSMMDAMKNNYKDISSTSDEDRADASAQGSYVSFVHDVVTLLQEHTVEICTIDKFFTDSAVFPLPANDPAYVVGRLRSFAPRLLEIRTQKELAVFVHTTLLRGLSGGKQDYVIDQIVLATAPSVHCNKDTLRLRSFFLGTVLPAYIAEATEIPALMWLMLPLLSAAEAMLTTSVYDLPVDDASQLDIIEPSICCLLIACSKHLAGCSGHYDRALPSLHILATLILRVCKASLTLVQWLGWHSIPNPTLIHALRFLANGIELGLVRPAIPQHWSWGNSTTATQRLDQASGRVEGSTALVTELPRLPEHALARSAVRVFIKDHILTPFIADWVVSQYAFTERQTACSFWSAEGCSGEHALSQEYSMALQEFCSAIEAVMSGKPCRSLRVVQGNEESDFLMLAELQI